MFTKRQNELAKEIPFRKKSKTPNQLTGGLTKKDKSGTDLFEGGF
jgi:hypothetical protein